MDRAGRNGLGRILRQTGGSLLLCAVALAVAAPGGRAGENDGKTDRELIAYPATLSKTCRVGRAKLYDECSDQLQLFAEALARANAEGKVLLVSYGAEWCIWCHAFDAYVRGGKDKFTYAYGSPRAPDKRQEATLYERATTDVGAEAEALQRLVAENFVVVHIDAQHAPNGAAVLKDSGAAKQYRRAVPFIFTVGANGKFVASLDSDEVETRRDAKDKYRGYQRDKLIAALTAMREAAREVKSGGYKPDESKWK